MVQRKVHLAMIPEDSFSTTSDTWETIRVFLLSLKGGKIIDIFAETGYAAREKMMIAVVLLLCFLVNTVLTQGNNSAALV